MAEKASHGRGVKYLDATKIEFGKRIYQELQRRGWRQAELARRIDEPRDKIGRYVNGISLPTDTVLQKIAAAFEVQPEVLLDPSLTPPTPIGPSVYDDLIPSGTIRITTDAGQHGLATVMINKTVSFKTALKIAELLDADEADQPTSD